MTSITVELIDSMGTDDRVVDAARVSFAKEAKNYTPEQNAKLIGYLAKYGHFTPFAHVQATFRIKAPFFVARQLDKHQVGLVKSEVSRRYVDAPPEFYMPEVWHKRAKNVKQGSSEETIEINACAVTIYADTDCVGYTDLGVDGVFEFLNQYYQQLLAAGVAPEEARMVLPLATMTEWYWTGSLAAWARVCKQRLDPHAQRQTREVARQIAEQCSQIWPVSWAALFDTTEN